LVERVIAVAFITPGRFVGTVIVWHGKLFPNVCCMSVWPFHLSRLKLSGNNGQRDIYLAFRVFHPSDILAFSASDLQSAGLYNGQEEMNANARLTERLVRDLNEDQSLPYKDEQFDAVSAQRL
jgi:hypothetical protein